MEAKNIEGGVRKYQSRNLFQKFRNFLTRQKVSGSSRNLYVEKNVELMRHPQNIYLSDDIILKEGVKICPTNNNAIIKIGSNTTIGYYSMLFSTLSIEVGNNCLVAPFHKFID